MTTLAGLFDSKYPDEVRTLTFDFTPDIGSNTIASITGIAVTNYGVDGNLGTDPAPAALLNGAAAADGTNKKVLQQVLGGKPGVSYLFSAAVVDSAGNHLTCKGILPIAAV